MLGAAAAGVVLLTVCAVPWIHGGTIPLARLVLQWGACLAGGLSLLAGLFRRSSAGFPSVIFPLGTLVCVGVVQLLPLHAPLISQMNHAVLAELRSDFTVSESNSSAQAVRSGSPADTRMYVAQLIALMLLATTAFDQMRSRRSVMIALAAFTTNAFVFSLLAFVQVIQGQPFLIRPEWWTGAGRPFGTFVNPNNASGWLAMGMASAVGLLVLQVRSTEYSGRHRVSRRSLVSRTTEYVARLNASQITTWLGLAVIACAIVAATSRGAMIAVVLAFLLTVGARLRRDQVFGTLTFGTIAVLGSYALVKFFGFDELALRELATLYEPVEAAAPRVEHWKASLQAVADFPLLGAGLGSYRFVTLPYQTHHSNAWFHHADNHYVEIVVEAGTIGFVAFVLMGLPSLVSSLLVIRRSTAGAATTEEHALALVLLFSAVTQGVCSFVDFGPALPAASSLFVVQIAMFAGIRAQRRQSQGAVRWLRPSMKLLLITASAVFITDLSAAQQCYALSIEATAVDRLPVSQDSLDQRAGVLELTKKALSARVDDADAHEVVSRLSTDLLRAEFVKGLPGIDQADNMQKAWPYTSSIAIVRRIDSIQDDPRLRQHLQSVFEARLKASGIIEHCEQLQQRLPVSGPILRRAARWAEAVRTQADASELTARARFSEPANAGLGIQLGEMALRGERNDRARDIFEQVLQVAPSVRGDILAVYRVNQLMELGFDHFGPDGFVDAVVAMRGQKDQRVLQRLKESAGEFWKEPETDAPPSQDIQLARSEFLGRVGEISEREAWLQRCVAWSPGNVRLRTELATVLAQLGRLDDSLVEWHEVQRLDPWNSNARRQASRIAEAIRRKVNSGR